MPGELGPEDSSLLVQVNEYAVGIDELTDGLQRFLDIGSDLFGRQVDEMR